MSTLAPNYASGNTILHNDYDLFVSGDVDGYYNTGVPNLGVVWGVGRGRYGYGQEEIYIAPVQRGDVVRAQHWDNLDGLLYAAISHQGGSYTPLVTDTIAAGAPIRPISQFDAAIIDAYNSVGNVYATSDSAPNISSYTGVWGSIGAKDLKFVQSVAFASADHARYFFNAGGKLKLNFARTGGAYKSRNSFWSGLCDAAGTVEIGYMNTRKIGGSGTGYGGYGQYGGGYTYNYGGYNNDNYFALNNNNGGFWGNTPDTLKLHFRQNSSGYGQYTQAGQPGYTGSTADFIKVEMRVYGDVGNNGGLGLVVEVTTTFENGSPVTPFSQDTIDGTGTTTMVISTPGLDWLEANPWGFPSFSGAAWAA